MDRLKIRGVGARPGVAGTVYKLLVKMEVLKKRMAAIPSASPRRKAATWFKQN